MKKDEALDIQTYFLRNLYVNGRDAQTLTYKGE